APAGAPPGECGAGGWIREHAAAEMSRRLYDSRRGRGGAETPVDGRQDAAETPVDGRQDAAETPPDGRQDAAETPVDGRQDAAETPVDGRQDAASRAPIAGGPPLALPRVLAPRV
ncbi:MAG: hypothetical protein OXG35_33010, partial [Acidobacteria bacterium]|nr:hypothetical protein [Acidobacteriota bacterium]